MQNRMEMGGIRSEKTETARTLGPFAGVISAIEDLPVGVAMSAAEAVKWMREQLISSDGEK